MSMCRVPLLLLEEGVSYDWYVLLAKLLAFALLHFVLVLIFTISYLGS